MLQLSLILGMAVALPIAWCLSEFQSRRWLRILLGTLAIFWSSALATGVGMLESLNSNAWFGSVTKDLIQNTIKELEAGNTDEVITELRRLRSRYEPSYENRAEYDKLVHEYVERVSSRPIIHDPGRPVWEDYPGPTNQ
jgi:hypothetical protein